MHTMSDTLHKQGGSHLILEQRVLRTRNMQKNTNTCILWAKSEEIPGNPNRRDLVG